MILETLLPQLEFQSNIEDAVKQKMIKSRRQVEEIAATAYSSNDFDFLLCKRMPLTRLVVVVYLLTQKYAEYENAVENDTETTEWLQNRCREILREYRQRKA